MAKNETIIFYSKDFFGDAVDASLTFYRNERIIYRTTFKQGRVEIKIPSQIQPGVYDIVAAREGGEYRVNNLMLSMATHYFSHAQKHNDIRIKDGNISPNEVLDSWKFNPILFNYIGVLPPNAKQIFNHVVSNSSHLEGMRWGGTIKLSRKLLISEGKAYVNSRLIAWREQEFDIPEIGIYNIGFLDGSLVLSSQVLDYRIAILNVEGEDWVRLTYTGTYHPIMQGNKSIYFIDYEENSEDIHMNMLDPSYIYGVVVDGKIYNRSRSTVDTTKVKLDVVGTGAVLRTNKFYVYATKEYFLLWEGTILLVALPRWKGSHMELDWSDGLVFSSWGHNGNSRWSSDSPYPRSHILFREGKVPTEEEDALRNIILEDTDIAGNRREDWEEVRKSSTSTIVWS